MQGNNLMISAEVPLDKIADFEEHYEEYNVGKSKKLQDSIKIAMSILNGESTYEGMRITVIYC